MTPRLRGEPFAILLSVAFFSSCSADLRSADEGAVVDTLSNGAIRVRNSPEGLWELAGGAPWRLVEDLRIGMLEGDDRYVFGQVRNVIPDAMGRI